jgi:hypothetical protein
MVTHRGKVLNPKTKRWVRVSGPVGKKLVMKKPSLVRHRRSVHKPCRTLRKKTCVTDSNCLWAKRTGCRTRKGGVKAAGVFALWKRPKITRKVTRKVGRKPTVCPKYREYRKGGCRPCLKTSVWSDLRGCVPRTTPMKKFPLRRKPTVCPKYREYRKGECRPCLKTSVWSDLHGCVPRTTLVRKSTRKSVPIPPVMPPVMSFEPTMFKPLGRPAQTLKVKSGKSLFPSLRKMFVSKPKSNSPFTVSVESYMRRGLTPKSSKKKSVPRMLSRREATPEF